mmetsp:Transcript_70891/g.125261  ORF Transcript_70891/g.125261 Transcript_70891/m.125261 type:complete len:94 (+) Transcript_70891:82-363(+)
MPNGARKIILLEGVLLAHHDVSSPDQLQPRSRYHIEKLWLTPTESVSVSGRSAALSDSPELATELASLVAPELTTVTAPLLLAAVEHIAPGDG